MTIAVRYFARLRETFGIAFEAVRLPAAGMTAITLALLLGELRARHGERADALLSPRIRIAIDGEIVPFDAAMLLRSGCEVAFLPPVTGG